ncbi:Protein detoxification 48 [Vitis vinifera]|uniref:Protein DETOXIFICATION n=1 Tax=Vitis vinifera TaxID=29760 RepID=A0A438KK03_VITVI|nr:Protein detoxification 48 [Vitis vinifera]
MARRVVRGGDDPSSGGGVGRLALREESVKLKQGNKSEGKYWVFVKMDYDKAPASSAPLLCYANNLSKSKESINKDLLGQEEDSQFSQHQLTWRPTLSEVFEEIKQLYSIALPMIITGLLIYGKSAISMLFMGRLGKEALAGGSLSIGFANITGYSVISGLAMGMEAISSQACGAKQWPLMAQTLQRTTAILASACIPISLLWLNVERILLFAAKTQPCLQLLPPTSHSLSLISFPIPNQSSQNLLEIPEHHSPSHDQRLIFTRSPRPHQLLPRLPSRPRHSRRGHGRGSNSYAGHPQLHISLLRVVVVRADDSPFRAVMGRGRGSGRHGILIQATSLVYIFPSSLSLAVSTRVGNMLGANQPGKAKVSALVALSCAIFTSFIAMSFMTTMRNAWGQAFSADKAIVSLTAMTMPVVGLCELGNCPQTTGCGVLRGSARPTLGANINLGSFYAIGLPISVLMGFFMDMGLLGLWLGLVGAQTVCALVMLLVTLRTDWVAQAHRARALTGIYMDCEIRFSTALHSKLTTPTPTTAPYHLWLHSIAASGGENMAIMCCIQAHPSAEMTVDEFKAWLRRFDSDRDGKISREELQEALCSLQVWFGWWKARQGMKEADTDHSGRIDNTKEMEKLVQYAQHHLHMKISENNW